MPKEAKEMVNPSLFDNTVTDFGFNLLLRAQEGTPIKFTKISVGDGYLPENQRMESIRRVVHEVMPLTNLTYKRGDMTATVVGYIEPGMVVEPFYFRELALYVEDPDTHDEVVFCYGNAADRAGLVNITDWSNPASYSFSVILALGRAANVSVSTDSTNFASLFYVNLVTAALEDEIFKIQDDLMLIDTKADKVDVGDKAMLETNDKRDIVSAVNELVVKIGDGIASHSVDPEAHRNLIATDVDLEGRLKRLEDMLLSGISSNPFLVTFEALDDVAVEGIWNEREHRIEF